MAGLAQVSQALAYRCAQLVYPQGLGAASISGRQVVVRRGWLLPNDVFAAQGIRNQVDYLTVTMVPRNAKNLPEPLGRPWAVRKKVAATVSVLQRGAGVQIVFPSDGSEPAGVVGVAVSGGQAAVYAVTATDTPDGVAHALADQLAALGVLNITAENGYLSISDNLLLGRASGYGESVRTVRRQTQRYRLTVWTADTSVREVLGDTIDTALAEMSWLVLADGGQAQIVFAGVEDVDTMQTETLYRRDYFYDIQFDTEDVKWSADLNFIGGHFTQGIDGSWGTKIASIQPEIIENALGAVQRAAAVGGAADVYEGLYIDEFGTVKEK
ncbi:hypothetical protein D5366_03465 [Neokomagataea tanensis]|uniref:Uncharacterized protein n=3 Tax=Neokomagataea TaxID=1223423 RepID=A0A4Y6V3D2_9PROT|nr:hypothetical protein [Neokomagataea tanensis]QDH24453.1 hypothetical protein D5366_03465 [Neokomagataea tanensis]